MTAEAARAHLERVTAFLSDKVRFGDDADTPFFEGVSDHWYQEIMSEVSNLNFSFGELSDHLDSGELNERAIRGWIKEMREMMEAIEVFAEAGRKESAERLE